MTGYPARCTRSGLPVLDRLSLTRRRDRARRRLRLGARHAGADRTAAARQRDRDRRLRIDGRGRARATRPGSGRASGRPARARARRAAGRDPLDRDISLDLRPRPALRPPARSPARRRAAERPVRRRGQHHRAARARRRGGGAGAVCRALSRLVAALELRRRGGDRDAPATGRLHERPLLACARADASPSIRASFSRRSSSVRSSSVCPRRCASGSWTRSWPSSVSRSSSTTCA